MTARELIKLGFLRQDVLAEEPYEADSYFYFYHFGRKDRLGLLSCGNEFVENDEWFVMFNSDDNVKFTKISDVKSIIEIMNRNLSRGR